MAGIALGRNVFIVSHKTKTPQESDSQGVSIFLIAAAIAIHHTNKHGNLNMPLDGKQQHRTEPPCTCDDCLRETAKADQRRAEIFDILRRLASEDEWRFIEAEVRR
jgi:hypothetical protein